VEKPVYIDEKIIKKNKPSEFPMQRLLKDIGIGYEYLQQGRWSDNKPAQKPEGKRLIFENIEQFRTVRDVYFAWKDLKTEQVYDPVRPEEIIRRMVISRRTGDELVLFVPWGVRPINEPINEPLVMDKVSDASNTLKLRGINTRILLMPADLYATEINQINEDLVSNYFDYVRQEGEMRGFEVKPWSQIRSDRCREYKTLANQLSEEAITTMMPGGVIERAIDASKRRSGRNGIRDVRDAAFAYLRERIIEAEIIEAIYQPIKISAVSKNKDSFVDRNLPRLYIVPEKLQFPWLK
jgi:hypothetical protein